LALTDSAIRSAEPGPKPYKMYDADGLFLVVTPSGGRWWRFKYMFERREKQLSLGTYPDVPLKRAREKRDEARRLVADGLDPAAQRRAERRALVSSFEAVALEWLEQKTPTWTPDYATIVRRLLERDVFPWIGSRPVATLHAADVLDCLRRIQRRGALETAHRARANCSQILRYAVATRRAERNPIVDLHGALPPVRSRHHASITEPAKVGELLRAIDGYRCKSISVSCALRLAPLVFTRPGELRWATWEEINLDGAEWRIPAERMKMRSPHVVPLSRQAVEIFREIHAYSGPTGYVFPSIRSFTRPISENTVNAALRRLGYTTDEMTGHGFRSIASTLLNEHGWNPDAIERQLAHGEQNGVRAAYNYAEHLPLRRQMMQAWADYLDTLRAAAREAERVRLAERDRPTARRRRQSTVDPGPRVQQSPPARR
jgi:integrase